MTHNEICTKIQVIRPGASWSLRGNTYESFEWHDAVQTKPTAEELGLA